MREITMWLELQMRERILNVFIHRLYMLRRIKYTMRFWWPHFVPRRIFKISVILRELKLDRDEGVSYDR